MGCRRRRGGCRVRNATLAICETVGGGLRGERAASRGWGWTREGVERVRVVERSGDVAELLRRGGGVARVEGGRWSLRFDGRDWRV